MTRPTLLLAAVALMAGAVAQSVAPAAEAGSGVRLQFGGPLGTFTAHPTPGYGAASQAAKPKSKPAKSKSYAQEKPATKAAKAGNTRTDQSKSRASRPTLAATQSAQRPVAKSAAAAATAPAEADPNSDVSITGAAALAAGQLPKSEPASEAVIEETLAAVAAPRAIIAETLDETERDAELTTVPEASDATSGPTDCKRFIPAVGVTVSVGCDE